MLTPSSGSSLDAPKLNVNTDEEVCSFIDQYVKCNIPDDEELDQLVSKVQKHRHSATSRRYGKYRFHIHVQYCHILS